MLSRSVCPEHNCEPTPLLVPVPSQVLRQLCERKLGRCTSREYRFYQIRREKCHADHLADITLAFSHCRSNHAQRAHFTAEPLLEPLMRLGERLDEPELVLRRHSAKAIPANHKPNRTPAQLQASRDAELNKIVFGVVERVVGYFLQQSTHGRFA